MVPVCQYVCQWQDTCKIAISVKYTVRSHTLLSANGRTTLRLVSNEQYFTYMEALPLVCQKVYFLYVFLFSMQLVGQKPKKPILYYPMRLMLILLLISAKGFTQTVGIYLLEKFSRTDRFIFYHGGVVTILGNNAIN